METGGRPDFGVCAAVDVPSPEQHGFNRWCGKVVPDRSNTIGFAPPEGCSGRRFRTSD